MNGRITTLLLLMLSLSSCNKEPVKPNGNDMPYPMQFVLLDKQGNELFISEDTPIKVSSLNSSGQRFYVDNHSEYPDGKNKVIKAVTPSATYPYHFIYSALTMPIASSNGSKEWYLELNGRTDTLHYDVQHTRPSATYNQYDVVSISLNGQPVVAHGDVNSPYYVLQRKH